jgi:hypothetical protein
MSRTVHPLIILASMAAACGGSAVWRDIYLSKAFELPAGSSQYGIFEGRTPCGDCQLVKMSLTFYRGSDGAPTGYKLARSFVGMGNDRYITEGEWKSVSGGGHPVIYQLDANSPADLASYSVQGPKDEVASFLPVGDDILLLLDQNLKPRVGNGAFSFTLSRTH